MEQAHLPVLPAHAVFAPEQRARLPDYAYYEATHTFTSVTAWWLARHPEDGFTTSFRGSVSLPPVVVASWLLVFTTVGSSSHGTYPPFLDALFGLSALILTLKGQIAPPATEVERVAYSMGSMEEMLWGSRVLGAMRDGGPDGPGGPADGEEARPRG